MYKIVPWLNVNGVLELDIDYKDLIQSIDNGDGTAIVLLKDFADPRDSWREATDQDWQNALAKLSQTAPPDTTQILGQFIVQQTLQNANFQHQLDAIGKSAVQLMLK